MTTGRPVLTTLVAFGGHGFEARKRWEHLALQKRGEGDGVGSAGEGVDVEWL